MSKEEVLVKMSNFINNPRSRLGSKHCNVIDEQNSELKQCTWSSCFCIPMDMVTILGQLIFKANSRRWGKHIDMTLVQLLINFLEYFKIIVLKYKYVHTLILHTSLHLEFLLLYYQTGGESACQSMTHDTVVS